MAKLQNTDNTKCWWVCAAIGTLICCWWERKMAQPLLKDSETVHYKTKHALTVRYNNHATRYLPKWAENLRPHKNLHMNVYSSCIHQLPKLEAIKMSEQENDSAFIQWNSIQC